MTKAEKVRVYRLVVIAGERRRVEKQVEKSLHGTKDLSNSDGDLRITSQTIGEFPEESLSQNDIEHSLNNERHRIYQELLRCGYEAGFYEVAGHIIFEDTRPETETGGYNAQGPTTDR